MTPPLFRCERERLGGAQVELTGPEGRHAATVRRLRPGERLDLSDGAGALARCVVETVGRDSLTCRVLERVDVPRPAPWLVVVQALAKGGRDEDALEAMTEVGVDEVVPWTASRAVARWKERSAQRWTATAWEAAKQARRPWVPVVGEPAGTAEVCARLRTAALGVVLHEDADVPLAAAPVPGTGEVVVVVGPEGGLTDDELQAYADAGATAYRLGPSVLRTSTAGVAAAAVLLSRTGRWA